MLVRFNSSYYKFTFFKKRKAKVMKKRFDILKIAVFKILDFMNMNTSNHKAYAVAKFEQFVKKC
jgi:hypothetical protein